MKLTILITLLTSTLCACAGNGWESIDASPVPVTFKMPKGYTLDSQAQHPNYTYKAKLGKGRDSVNLEVLFMHKPGKAALRAKKTAMFFRQLFNEESAKGRAFLLNGRIVYELKYKDGKTRIVKRITPFGNDYYSVYTVYSKDEYENDIADYLMNSFQSDATLHDYGIPIDDYVKDANYALSDNKNWKLDQLMPPVIDSSGLSFRMPKEYRRDTTINDTTNRIAFNWSNQSNRAYFVSISTIDDSRSLEKCEKYIHEQYLEFHESDTTAKDFKLKTTEFKINGYPAMRYYIESDEDGFIEIITMVSFKQYNVVQYLKKRYDEERFFNEHTITIKLEDEDYLFLNSLKIED